MSKNENANPANPDQGASGGAPAVPVEESQPVDQNDKQRVPAPWSSEVIAVVSTGVAVFGAIVALFVAMMTGFNSLRVLSSQEQMHRDTILENVRTQLDNRLDNRIETIRRTVDENLDAQNLRIHAIERDQARLEGALDGTRIDTQ